MNDLQHELERRDLDNVAERAASIQRFTPIHDYSVRHQVCPVCSAELRIVTFVNGQVYTDDADTGETHVH